MEIIDTHYNVSEKFTVIKYKHENNIYRRVKFDKRKSKVSWLDNIPNYFTSIDLIDLYNQSDTLYLPNIIKHDNKIFFIDIGKDFFKKYKFNNIIVDNTDKNGVVYIKIGDYTYGFKQYYSYKKYKKYSVLSLVEHDNFWNDGLVPIDQVEMYKKYGGYLTKYTVSYLKS